MGYSRSMGIRKGRELVLPIAILIISLAAITFGVIEKEYLTVLQKSTIICMECIGLG